MQNEKQILMYSAFYHMNNTQTYITYHITNKYSKKQKQQIGDIDYLVGG